MIYFVGVRSPCRCTGLARQFQLAMRPALPFSPAPKQAPVRKRIREIAKTWMRYRDRRIHVLLRRDGCYSYQISASLVSGNGFSDSSFTSRHGYNSLGVRHCPPRCPDRYSCAPLYEAYGPLGGQQNWASLFLQFGANYYTKWGRSIGRRSEGAGAH